MQAAMTLNFFFVFCSFVFKIVFRFSKVVGLIDNTDDSIISNTTTVRMRKTFSPTLKIGIGLAYVDVNYLDDENIYIKIRDKFMKAIIVNTPFI